MADQQSQVRLENKTEHVLHIALAGGEIVTVPPTDQGGGTTLTLATAEERTALEQALQTETVAAWIKDGQLVVHTGSSHAAIGGGGGGQPHESAPTSPASRRGREKE